ncbi:hypothetical protein KUCAC02_026796 [Chaenocephalus aceratus]|nr:hypothetical protein KUCAC02_026796 [Chaenocephalus aceratus]
MLFSHLQKRNFDSTSKDSSRGSPAAYRQSGTFLLVKTVDLCSSCPHRNGGHLDMKSISCWLERYVIHTESRRGEMFLHQTPRQRPLLLGDLFQQHSCGGFFSDNNLQETFTDCQSSEGSCDHTHGREELFHSEKDQDLLEEQHDTGSPECSGYAVN